MIEIDEKKLLLLIEDALWAFDSYGYYYSNTKHYFEDMLKENILELSKESLDKLENAIKERLTELKVELKEEINE